MKKRIILSLCLLVCLAVLTSCAKSGDPTATTAPTGIPTAAPGGVSVGAVTYLSSLELGAGEKYTWTAMFSVTDTDGNPVTDLTALTAHAEILNNKGVSVYDGAPALSAQDGLVKCTVNYGDVTAGGTVFGTGTVTLSAAGKTAEGVYKLNLLPYDMSDIVLPDLPVTVNKLAGDSSVSATMEITELTKELRYRGDTVNVRINLKAKRTFTNGTNDYIGATAVITVNGEEIDRIKVIDKVNESGEISKYFSIEYVAGSAPVITFEDYQ